MNYPTKSIDDIIDEKAVAWTADRFDNPSTDHIILPNGNKMPVHGGVGKVSDGYHTFNEYREIITQLEKRLSTESSKV